MICMLICHVNPTKMLCLVFTLRATKLLDLPFAIKREVITF